LDIKRFILTTYIMKVIENFFSVVASPADRWARDVVGTLVLFSGFRYSFKRRPWAALGVAAPGFGCIGPVPAGPTGRAAYKGKGPPETAKFRKIDPSVTAAPGVIGTREAVGER
jgi:hypothetical protein